MLTFLIMMLAGVILILVWMWALRSASTPKKNKRHPVYSSSLDEEPPYQSPLGLVDDPDDEWVEWAIMDDLLSSPDDEC